MRSKEELVLEPFFNRPKYWHFDELHKKIGISRPQLSYWLKKFEKKKIIQRVKLRGKMPYYIGVFENPEFQNRKRLFALKQLTDSGLLNHLSTLDRAKLVILFGSFSRYDWYDHSDIDIFIYGNDDEFEQGKYELKLDREIQLFTAKNKEDFKKMGSGLIQNMLEGFIVKGDLEQLGVRLYV